MAAAALAATVLYPALAFAAPGGLFGPSGTTVVTPEAANRFAGTFDTGQGGREFTERLGAPADGGTGALELRTPGDDDKVQFITDELAGSLERFRESSYQSLRDPASEAGAFPSFQIAIDANGGELEPRDLYLLTFVPPAGPAGVWTRFDLGSAGWCTTHQIGRVDAYRECRDGGARRSLDEIMDAFPDVSVYAAGVNQGAGNAGLVGAVDLIRVGNLTYDFEPSAAP
ncbi:hypothetical protein ACLFMI_17270 [Pseudonocardia nantongensis]|uniref:hypothetical protein n=1 Tax=Pseudonocardia nantongensis TaxID=1181885 RepID=UPI00397B036A